MSEPISWLPMAWVASGGVLVTILTAVISLYKGQQMMVKTVKHQLVELPQPTPGMFGLTRIGGVLGFFISLGQWLVGDASRYTHAFIVLDSETVMEAMPSGARISPLADVMARRPIAFSWSIELTETQAERIVILARACRGVKYGFSAYLYLALSFLGIESKKLRGYLLRNERLICSQLVDYVYTAAGVQLFDDGRAPFDVTPGDLANVLIERRWMHDEPGKHAEDR